MANYCNNTFIIAAPENIITEIQDIITGLSPEADVLASLANGNAATSTNAVWGVAKTDFNFEKDSDTKCAANFDSKNEYPDEFYKNFSKKFTLKITAYYEIEADDVKGVLFYERGVLEKKEEYKYIEGFYKLESVEDFWEEVESKMENDYLDNYDSFEEIASNEFSFLSKKDKTNNKPLSKILIR